MKLLRMTPGRGDVLLAEGDPAVTEAYLGGHRTEVSAQVGA